MSSISRQAPCLDSIPIEIALHIADDLNEYDMKSASLVCKGWNHTLVKRLQETLEKICIFIRDKLPRERYPQTIKRVEDNRETLKNKYNIHLGIEEIANLEIECLVKILQYVSKETLISLTADFEELFSNAPFFADLIIRVIMHKNREVHAVIGINELIKEFVKEKNWKGIFTIIQHTPHYGRSLSTIFKTYCCSMPIVSPVPIIHAIDARHEAIPFGIDGIPSDKRSELDFFESPMNEMHNKRYNTQAYSTYLLLLEMDFNTTHFLLKRLNLPPATFKKVCLIIQDHHSGFFDKKYYISINFLKFYRSMVAKRLDALIKEQHDIAGSAPLDEDLFLELITKKVAAYQNHEDNSALSLRLQQINKHHEEFSMISKKIKSLSACLLALNDLKLANEFLEGLSLSEIERFQVAFTILGHIHDSTEMKSWKSSILDKFPEFFETIRIVMMLVGVLPQDYSPSHFEEGKGKGGL